MEVLNKQNYHRRKSAEAEMYHYILFLLVCWTSYVGAVSYTTLFK